MATPNRSAVFADVLDGLVSRLNRILGREAGDTFVRVVIAPSPDLAPYRAEAGVHLIVLPPDPDPKSGGGRYGKKVVRTVLAYVKTESLLDQAGEDIAAVRAQLALEDQVIDAVDNFNPNLTAPEKTAGGPVLIRWKPGGAQMARGVNTDTGLVGSVLAFEVEYAQAFTTL